VINDLFRNDGGVFSAVSAGLPVYVRSGSIWGDYDADGRLDVVVITGSPMIRTSTTSTTTMQTPPTRARARLEAWLPRQLHLNSTSVLVTAGCQPLWQSAETIGLLPSANQQPAAHLETSHVGNVSWLLVCRWRMSAH